MNAPGVIRAKVKMGGDDGEVSCSIHGRITTRPEETIHIAGLWKRTGAVGEGGPARPDDTLRGASASTKMENWKSLVAGPL